MTKLERFTPVRNGGVLTDRPANPFHVREWNEKGFDELPDALVERGYMIVVCSGEGA